MRRRPELQAADGTLPVPPLAESARRNLAALGLTIDLARREAFYRAGWWRDRTLLDDFDEACERHPHKTAVVGWRADSDRPQRRTYGELAIAVRRFAAGLIHLGVSSGEVVSVQMPNWWEFAVVAFAVQRIGAVLNPIPPIHRRREVTFITGLLESEVYVAAGSYRNFDYAAMFADVAREVPSLRHLIVVGADAQSGGLSFESDLLGVPWEERYGAELQARSVDPDGPSDLMFTSGTTGEPKGVGHTHNTQYARFCAVNGMLGLDASDVVLMPSTVGHSTGFVYGCMTPLSQGMTAVFQDVWDPRRALDIVAAEHVTWMFGSTTFIIDMVRAHEEHPVDVSSLRYFISGGATIPPAIVAQTRDRLDARLMAVWGMTENGAVTITRPEESVMAAAESDGWPCPWMEAKVVDATTGERLESGREGALRVRGASQMIGYVRRPALNAAAFDSEGWFDTGDVARMDAAGHVRITGRSKDIIIRGGENIPVAELEALLYEDPDIADVAVVGYPDERLGERACAVVVPTGGGELTLADVTRFLERANTPRPYWPERLELREELPRTASGKVQKFKLKEELAEDPGTP